MDAREGKGMIKLERTTPEKYADIARHISAIVTAGQSFNQDGIPYEKEPGSFVLDRENNWFAHFATVQGVTGVRIVYRYENKLNAESIEGLRKFVEWKLTKNFRY
jgi:hypothetical protein